jgi:hypothetical protein
VQQCRKPGNIKLMIGTGVPHDGTEFIFDNVFLSDSLYGEQQDDTEFVFSITAAFLVTL